MKLFQTIARLAGILLIAVCIMAGKTVDADKSLTPAGKLEELNGGCITSGDQVVVITHSPNNLLIT